MIAPPNDHVVNVLFLNQVPPELMHMVLEFVQKYPQKDDWRYMEELLQNKTLLESAAHHDDSTDFIDEVDELEEEDEGYTGIPLEEVQRQQAEAIKLVQIKTLSLLMSVVKGVVVPMFFSA